MGGRKEKKKKIAAISTFGNVFQHQTFDAENLENAAGESIQPKGKWNEVVFKKDQPITLELACGKGEYTVNLARAYPDRNFIGVDLKGPRIFTGAKMALDEGLDNVAFLRMKIENIVRFFAPGEVAEIWITFPDPFPKDRHEKHRLTHPLFLAKYKQILQPNGIIQLKTDDLGIFRFTKEVVEAEKLKMLYYKEDIYAAPLDFDFLQIKTYYESLFLAENKPINYLQFSFP